MTLIDKRNFHLFQPLLYQVATGTLSPGDIASPLRSILRRQKNTSVLLGNVVGFDEKEGEVILLEGRVPFDSLVLATGSTHSYFGHEEWQSAAPGLKTVEDALEIRSKILTAFEAAEAEKDPDKRRKWLRILIIGGGPTGVELAGAIAEISRKTLKNEFRNFDPAECEIILIEASNRILSSYSEILSERAEEALRNLGAQVHTGTLVTEIKDDRVTLQRGEATEYINAMTVLWSAGVQGSPLGKKLVEEFGGNTDNVGRVVVDGYLNIPNRRDIYVIGDLAKCSSELPGTAPVAMQQGKYVADSIVRKLKGKEALAFVYKDKGNLAVIGRNAAVAELGRLKLSGFPAWVLWVFVHIWYLIGFDNKLLVMLQWAWNYITFSRTARLIVKE